MKIVVLIKYTPETSELPKVTEDEVRSGDIQVKMVPNPWDEYAAEEAIELCDRFDGEAIALTMGSPDAADALKHALAMGVGNAALVDSSELSGGDAWTTAAALAAAYLVRRLWVEPPIDGESPPPAAPMLRVLLPLGALLLGYALFNKALGGALLPNTFAAKTAYYALSSRTGSISPVTPSSTWSAETARQHASW